MIEHDDKMPRPVVAFIGGIAGVIVGFALNIAAPSFT